jgi:hypothetical protein
LVPEDFQVLTKASEALNNSLASKLAADLTHHGCAPLSRCLESLASCIRDAIAIGGSLAAALDAPAPTTVAGVHKLTKIAALALAPHKPPAAWFSGVELPAIRNAIDTLGPAVAKVRESRASVETLFDLAILSADAEGLECRRIVRVAITEHPTASWTAQQIIEAFPDETAPRWLVRDRDAIYGEGFRRRVASMGITEVVSAPSSPWQNPYVERLIGSIRPECLDHIVVFNEVHLRGVLSRYVVSYHRARTHLSLAKDAHATPGSDLHRRRSHHRVPGSWRPPPPIRTARRIGSLHAPTSSFGWHPRDRVSDQRAPPSTGRAGHADSSTRQVIRKRFVGVLRAEKSSVTLGVRVLAKDRETLETAKASAYGSTAPVPDPTGCSCGWALQNAEGRARD